ncbi:MULTISPECIES: MarR family transcriptional regulator [unclassified Clostridium]|uniref:MarR family winged helix-turn-helix transcriptional regulator n=1 Tax=unclassified Clostridium TaxID=2614128 RepID=UPI0013FA83B2|nr:MULTISPECIES: MarR family transcriptional regulator [unclassified Clostridium]MBN1054026.1 MarR family transcriptional regulator [Clostridium botulinum]NFR86904.1 MarR family transcriptional regulator [Clostridium botulinum]NFR90458.1 MarR family transcriptional regulator [Clostridium botulinum]NFT98342.1 MarR family transcriptional regulator [Clostridium botulinum]
MHKQDLDKISDSLLTFLFLVKNNVFSENEFIKNFPKPPKEVEDYMNEFPMPPSHTKVILYLHKSSSSPISQIASNLGISKSNMTPIIDKLIEYGLVNRYPDSKDRRILRVELTAKALDIFEKFRNAAKAKLASKIEILDDDDLYALSDCVSKLYNIMQKIEKK